MQSPPSLKGNNFYLKILFFRFLKDNKPYNCEDLTGECRKWSSNGACQVNVTYVTR